MVLHHVLSHSLLFALIVNGYLLMVMITTSPRVWGYADYSQAIRDKVPPQTTREKRLAWIIGLPWMIFALGFPMVSTYVLKSNLGGEILFGTALLNVIAMVSLATIGDLVLLDWLIVNKITPDFVIIPGTEKADYQDFSHHYKAHARAAIYLVVLSFIYAGIAWFF